MEKFSAGLRRLMLRFGRDEGGVFAVVFAVMAVVLIALGGAVVDFVQLQQTRTRGQLALDAAALALQSEVFNNNVNQTEILAKANALVRDRIGEFSVGGEPLFSSVDEIRMDVPNGSLYLAGQITVPTIFVRLVGVDQLSARLSAEARRKKLAMDVVFVLDNSGSMKQTGAGANGTRQRIQFLRDAAKCATNILFYGEVVDDPRNSDTCIKAADASQTAGVQIGVVPFTMFVNVGAANRNAPWLDRTGASAISNDNFDVDDDETTLGGAVPDRLALFSAVGESWRGCVEARPHVAVGGVAGHLDTNDAPAIGGNSLFVPLFSPDMVDDFWGANSYLNDTPAICDRPSNNYGDTTCLRREVHTGCNNNLKGCTLQSVTTKPIGPVNFSSDDKYPSAYYGAHAPGCTCRTTKDLGYKYHSGKGANQTYHRDIVCAHEGYVPTGLSKRVLQERICKYYAGNASTSFSSGPNADCTRAAIQPLTENPSAVSNLISTMTAEGGTNIHEGTAWGFRALSPGLPFDARPYEEDLAKVLIIMTDGENTAYNLGGNYCASGQRSLNGSCFNSAYGFPYNSTNSNGASSSGGGLERLGRYSPPTPTGALGVSNAALVSEMNARTRETCENIKDAGITIYTIGLATAEAQQSSRAEVEDMLADCATTRDNAYFPQSPGELKSVFRDIANELGVLHLSQ